VAVDPFDAGSPTIPGHVGANFRPALPGVERHLACGIVARDLLKGSRR